MAAAAEEEKAGLQASSVTARKGPFAETKGFICPVRPSTSLGSCDCRTLLHVPDYLLVTCWLCPVPASRLFPRRTWNMDTGNGVSQGSADTRDGPQREGPLFQACQAREL